MNIEKWYTIEHYNNSVKSKFFEKIVFVLYLGEIYLDKDYSPPMWKIKYRLWNPFVWLIFIPVFIIFSLFNGIPEGIKAINNELFSNQNVKTNLTLKNLKKK